MLKNDSEYAISMINLRLGHFLALLQRLDESKEVESIRKLIVTFKQEFSGLDLKEFMFKLANNQNLSETEIEYWRRSFNILEKNQDERKKENEIINLKRSILEMKIKPEIEEVIDSEEETEQPQKLIRISNPTSKIQTRSSVLLIDLNVTDDTVFQSETPISKVSNNNSSPSPKVTNYQQSVLWFSNQNSKIFIDASMFKTLYFPKIHQYICIKGCGKYYQAKNIKLFRNYVKLKKMNIQLSRYNVVAKFIPLEFANKKISKTNPTKSVELLDEMKIPFNEVKNNFYLQNEMNEIVYETDVDDSAEEDEYDFNNQPKEINLNQEYEY